MKEEIIKMFHRIELDKTNDSCGFEFADGFSCTFDNIATCYDDRLKLYDLVKDLQSQLKAKEEVIKEAMEYMNSEEFFIKMNSNSIQPPPDKYCCQDYFEAKEKLLEILSKGENK